MRELRVVNDLPDDDDDFPLEVSDAPLREQINRIVDSHRERVIESVRRWILYWVRQGARQLPLDECPSMAAEDRDFVVAWLRREGFTVHYPRIWGQVVIDLQVERRQMVSEDHRPERRQRRRRREVPEFAHDPERRAVTQTVSGIKRRRRSQ